MKEVVGLKEMEGVLDSNQRVRKSTGGRSSMSVMTNSKCMADELQLKYNDRQTEQKAPKTKGVKSVRILGSFCRNWLLSGVCFPERFDWLLSGVFFPGRFDVQEYGEGTKDETQG